MTDDTRPWLVFLVDVPGWAYDNIANKVTPGLADRFEISRLYVKDHPDLATLVGALIELAPPAIVHVFWRPLLFDLLDRVVLRRCEKQLGLADGEVLQRLSRLIITTGVYDHLGLDPVGLQRQATVLSAIDGYSTASPILDRIYREAPGMPPPQAMLADGVDLQFYHPRRPERLTETDRPFVIGWVGNSQWGLLEGLPDAKGLNTVIRPAVAALQARGMRVELRLVDRAERWRSREEVAEFYHGLDALLCASLVEGTPNPVLEAMASGVPIISTDVGIVRHCSGPLQQSLIVERHPEAFAEAISRLCETPGLRAAIGRENLDSIANHSWEVRQSAWRAFFAAALERGAARAISERFQALADASSRLKPTFKMRVRSLLRRSPVLYALAGKLLHGLTRASGSVRVLLAGMLDRGRPGGREGPR